MDIVLNNLIYSNQDLIWLIVCTGFLIIMQAGFTCLEAGLVRRKNAINVALKNFADLTISSSIFWIWGFALLFGVSHNGLLGTTGFFLNEIYDPWQKTFFLFELMFCGTAVTIISGAIAERVRFLGYLIIGMIVSGIIYPLFGHWAWAGLESGQPVGWLAERGFIDFAGSTVVHSVGGWVALAALIILGPRTGRYNREKKFFQPNNIPLAVLGGLLLWIGWFGFNGGSTLHFNQEVPNIILNTLLAGISGSLSSLLISWIILKRPSPETLINGSLSGLVAITACCNIVDDQSSIIIGLVAGLLSFFATQFLEKQKIDDVVNAIPIHCVNGVWGTLAVALFGDPSSWGSRNSVLEQLWVQMEGVGICFVWSFGTAYVFLWGINKVFPLRVNYKEERIGLDISEHNLEALEEKLLRDEALISATIDNLTEGVAIFDPKGVVESFNPAAEKMFGYSSNEIIGKNLNRLFTISEKISENILIKKLIQWAESQPSKELEGMGIKKDQNMFPVELRIKPMHVEEHLLYVCIIRDITEQKKYLQELEEYQNHLEQLVNERTKELNSTNVQLAENQVRLNSIIENIADGLITINDKGIIQSFNSSAERIFGYEASEVIGKNISYLAPEPYASDHDNYLKQYLSNKKSKIIGIGREVRGLSKAGKTFPMDLAINEMVIGEKIYFVGIVRDITERKEIEKQLIKTKEDAEKANYAKSKFLSSMSHELRTPLNAILGFGQLLKNDSKMLLSPAQQDRCKEIINAGNHLLALINEILDLASIESGKTTFSIENVNLKEIVSESLTLLRPMAKKRDIDIFNLMDPNEEIFVNVDRLRFKQVLLNLLSNAVKYNKEGGTISIDYSLMESDQVQIKVSDTGPGISKEKQKEIFEPFNRIGFETTGIEGTGIGLSLTKSLVEMMNGTIGVDSTPGKGSCFMVNFPMGKNPVNKNSVSMGQPKVRKNILPADKKFTLLYIEDNPANHLLVKEILSNRDEIRFVSAGKADIGIELAKKHQPELILMDINLPEIDGITAFKYLQSYEETKNIPVIAVSANAMETDKKKALSCGFEAYITKPFSIPHFLKTIDEYLAKNLSSLES